MAYGRDQAKLAILDVLIGSPSGKYAREIAAVVDMHPGVVATRLGELRSSGRAMSVQDGGHAKRLLWFHPDHQANAGKRQIEAEWRFGCAQARPKTTTVAKALAPKTKFDGRVKVTSSPPWVDVRYHVDDPNPVFAGLKPGQYPVATGSAIERAYRARTE